MGACRKESYGISFMPRRKFKENVMFVSSIFLKVDVNILPGRCKPVRRENNDNEI